MLLLHVRVLAAIVVLVALQGIMPGVCIAGGTAKAAKEALGEYRVPRLSKNAALGAEVERRRFDGVPPEGVARPATLAAEVALEVVEVV